MQLRCSKDNRDNKSFVPTRYARHNSNVSYQKMIFHRKSKWVLFFDIALFVILIVAILLALNGVEVKPVRIFFETYMPTDKARYVFVVLIPITYIFMVLIGVNNRKKYGDVMNLFAEANLVLLILHGIYIG